LRRTTGSGRVAAAIAAASIAAACTAGSTPGAEESAPGASEAADVFLTAFAAGDYEGMAAALAPGAKRGWTPERLERWIGKRLETGLITDVAADRTEGIEELTSEELQDDAVAVTAEVPYSITYTSEAVGEAEALDGVFEMVLDRDREEWLVEWDRSWLWPGLDRAAGFEIVERWPPRAPILDRGGRPIARGDGSVRRYPFGTLAGSTIGHIGPSDAGNAPMGLGPDGLGGGSGLEAAFDEQLRGTPSTELTVVDRAGRVQERLGEERGRRGKALRTTLDMRIQRAAQAAYGGETGGAVVLAPRTGDLLAVVDSGTFDPGNYVGVGLTPFNRALVGLYPPGSAMKVVTAAAGLDSGKITPSTRVTGPGEYKGVRNFESGVFGTIDFATAVKFSVNTAFAQVAEKIGARVLTRYAEAFGFNREPALELEVAESSFPPPEDLGDLMWGSIGQAQVVATPLQMATVAATVANDGTRMEPRVSMRNEPSGERAVSRRSARTLTGLMEAVVQGGTGSAAAVSGVRVAGKTGTAEVDVEGERKNHAWFIAFAPAENPKVAVAVVSEYGGVGGQVAAPIAGDILRGVLPLAR
jgi:penicillin-binding protein A